MSPIEELTNALTEVGARRYGDVGAVSQLQHALQCAALAERANSSPELITAALLHDVGHVIDKRFDGAAAAGIDRKHEQTGAAYLARWFGPEVTEPVRLHVPAKRYLCAVDGDYMTGLSAGSIRSLELQGGLFDGPGAKAFAAQPHAAAAIRLRRWDDLAKDPEAETPDLDYFMSYASVALTRSQVA